MSLPIPGQLQDINFNGHFRGRVVNNVDEHLEGSIGVFIPALVVDMPDSMEGPAPLDNPISAPVFHNQDEIPLRSSVREDNYIWARPCSALVENGSDSNNFGGSFKIPKIGTMVWVIFEGGDPNRPYWLPFTPTVEGDVISGANIGKGIGTGEAGANWKDPAKRVNIEVMTEFDNGNVVYIDANDNANTFVIRWANGHTVSLQDSAESGINLNTAKGHLVQLDDNSGEIRVRTHTNQSSAIFADSGKITVNCSGDLVAKSGGSTSLTAGGPVTIKSSAAVTIIAPAINLAQG